MHRNCRLIKTFLSRETTFLQGIDLPPPLESQKDGIRLFWKYSNRLVLEERLEQAEAEQPAIIYSSNCSISSLPIKGGWN